MSLQACISTTVAKNVISKRVVCLLPLPIIRNLVFNAYFTIVKLYYSMQLVFLFARTKLERKILRPNVRQHSSKLQHLAWTLLAFSFLRRAFLTFNNNKHECFTSRRPSHSQFSKELVHYYVWLGSEFRKGSNQFASAFYHKLTSIDLTTVRTMNPKADGFVGKNKVLY